MDLTSSFGGPNVAVLSNSKVKVVVGDCSRERPEGPLFNSYYTEV